MKSLIKKYTAVFLFSFIAFLLSPIPSFAVPAATDISMVDFQKFEPSTPAECGSARVEGSWITPRSCVFLDEPIGGKVNYDLYTVTCQVAPGESGCINELWNGGSIPPNAYGPIQAILSFTPGKEYQGPFGLLYGYLGIVYKYMSGLIVGMVVLFTVIGGIQMTTSGGDETKFSEGKARITRAIVGMILWFTASLILYTINPTFFSF